MSIPFLPTDLPKPSVSMPRDREARARELTFGDGYNQSSEDGLNSIQDTVSLSWPGLTEEQADRLDDFLTERAGVRPFYWLYPRASAPQKWKCRKWTRVPRKSKGRDSITATFKEAFDLDS